MMRSGSSKSRPFFPGIHSDFTVIFFKIWKSLEGKSSATGERSVSDPCCCCCFCWLELMYSVSGGFELSGVKCNTSPSKAPFLNKETLLNTGEMTGCICANKKSPWLFFFSLCRGLPALTLSWINTPLSAQQNFLDTYDNLGFWHGRRTNWLSSVTLFLRLQYVLNSECFGWDSADYL